MWIKILCIEYILWGIPTIESTFDVANMVKTATVKDVPINNDTQVTGHVKISLWWYLAVSHCGKKSKPGISMCSMIEIIDKTKQKKQKQ